MLNATTSRQVFERYLTEEEERQLLRHVSKFADVLAQRDAAWMGLLRQTGIRVGSMAQLTLGDAQQALRTGHLQVRAEIAKGERGYDVPLNKRARASLQALLRVRKSMGGAPGLDAPLVLSRNHRAMSVRSYQSRMLQWVREAGLSVRASPHWLRHTLAKRVLARSEARDPLGIVQVVLGHRNRESTVVYTLPDREDIAAAMDMAQ